MKIKSLKTPVQFSSEIERLVQTKDIEYFEAILLYAEMNGLEVEVVASLVRQNQQIKAKLAEEAEGLRLIKKTEKLPL